MPFSDIQLSSLFHSTCSPFLVFLEKKNVAKAYRSRRNTSLGSSLAPSSSVSQRIAKFCAEPFVSISTALVIVDSSILSRMALNRIGSATPKSSKSAGGGGVSNDSEKLGQWKHPLTLRRGGYHG